MISLKGQKCVEKVNLSLICNLLPNEKSSKEGGGTGTNEKMEKNRFEPLPWIPGNGEDHVPVFFLQRFLPKKWFRHDRPTDKETNCSKEILADVFFSIVALKCDALMHF